MLVHAAAGGVGLLLTQMVKLRGGRVIATTSTEEKAALARGAGADETLGYDGFAERVRELTGGKGVEVVYDGDRARTRSTAAWPRCAGAGCSSSTGWPAGPARRTTSSSLRKGSLYVTRPGLPDYTATREELEWRASEVFGWIADGRLDVRIGERYAARRTRAAPTRTSRRAAPPASSCSSPKAGAAGSPGRSRPCRRGRCRGRPAPTCRLRLTNAASG